jgi:hypothetical protein
MSTQFGRKGFNKITEKGKLIPLKHEKKETIGNNSQKCTFENDPDKNQVARCQRGTPDISD